jgi:hypothetical protein
MRCRLRSGWFAVSGYRVNSIPAASQHIQNDPIRNRTLESAQTRPGHRKMGEMQTGRATARTTKLAIPIPTITAAVIGSFLRPYVGIRKTAQLAILRTRDGIHPLFDDNCEACGTPNSENNEFCGSCGKPESVAEDLRCWACDSAISAEDRFRLNCVTPVRTIIHNFTRSDGATFSGGLIADSGGNLYGAAAGGGYWRNPTL